MANACSTSRPRPFADPMRRTADLMADCVSLVLVASLIVKLVDPAETLRAIGALFPGATDAQLRAMLLMLFASEAMLAAWLFSRLARSLAHGAAVVFLVVMTGVVLRLQEIEHAGGCGCGLTLPNVAGLDAMTMALIRNVGLVSLAIMGVIASARIGRDSRTPV